MRNPATKIVIVLLIGAVTNIFVAWGCCFTYLTYTPMGTPDVSRMSLGTVDEPAVLDWFETYHPFGSQLDLRHRRSSWMSWTPGYRTTRILFFAADEVNERDYGYHTYSAEVIQVGLPLHSLTGVRWMIQDNPHSWHPLKKSGRITFGHRAPASRPATDVQINGLLTLRSTHIAVGSGHLMTPTSLPLTPVTLGFALNTATYASVTWLALFAPGVLRRAIRRRRGQCARCNYDLRGGPHERCPECGHAVRSERSPNDANGPAGGRA